EAVDLGSVRRQEHPLRRRTTGELVNIGLEPGDVLLRGNRKPAPVQVLRREFERLVRLDHFAGWCDALVGVVRGEPHGAEEIPVTVLDQPRHLGIDGLLAAVVGGVYAGGHPNFPSRLSPAPLTRRAGNPFSPRENDSATGDQAVSQLPYFLRRGA